MAKAFTSDQLKLLYSSAIKGRWLVTFTLDTGVYRFCDDVTDMVDSAGNVYIGANALAASADIVSSKPYAAESVELTIDGARVAASGIDPGNLFHSILGLKLHQRRVDMAVALSYPNSQVITLITQVYAGKVNNIQLVDAAADLSSLTQDGGIQQATKLIITLDSLASRYGYSTGRTRSHSDQLQIDPTDLFFQFVNDSVVNDSNLYWGRKPPAGVSSGIGPGGVAGIGAAGGGSSSKNIGGSIRAL